MRFVQSALAFFVIILVASAAHASSIRLAAVAVDGTRVTYDILYSAGPEGLSFIGWDVVGMGDVIPFSGEELAVGGLSPISPGVDVLAARVANYDLATFGTGPANAEFAIGQATFDVLGQGVLTVEIESAFDNTLPLAEPVIVDVQSLVVPEPSSGSMLLAGILALWGVRRRCSRRSSLPS